MGHRFFYLTALGLLSGVVMVSAQPGPITTSNNSNLVFAASTLLTNGLPGLPGPPVTLMVATVQPNSAQGGAVSLATGQPWVRRYNGTANSEDQAYAVVADKDGNIIVGGYSVGIGSSIDFVTIKYTLGGIGLWTNRYDGPDHGADRIEAVAVDGSGGVYVSGESGTNIVTIKYTAQGSPVWTNTYSSTNDFLLFGAIAADNDGNAYMLPYDLSDTFITVKYDVNGNPDWTNYFQSSPFSSDTASDLAVDAAGNIFVTGWSFDSFSGATVFVTIKYAPDGSLLWTQPYSRLGLESALRVIVDSQGNVIVVGDSDNAGAQKHPLVKYSNDGTPIWTNIIAGPGYAGGGVPEIATDPAGNVFLVAGTPGATTADYTTVKYSSTGLPLWTNRFVDPNAGNDSFFGASTDNAGNLYWAINSASPGGASYNFVTLKYAATGAAVWTNRYNGPANADDLPRAMTVDTAGGVYVSGISSSGGTSLSSFDWATVKYADNVRYVPPPGFIGQDTITFTAFDGFGNSAVGSVIINVVAAPAAPPSVVAPAAYTSVAGNGGLNTIVRGASFPRTYQMQFTPAVLGGLPAGARITALGFRVSTIPPFATFPVTTVTWSDYQVTLAQAANSVAGMSTTFSANLRNPVLVKSGPLSVGANQFTVGASPNAFGTLVVLDTPYVYQGGDLVMHFTHPGSDSTNTAFMDGATITAPGYGTSFRALTANSFGFTIGTNATATIVQIMFAPPITQTITRSGNQVIINGAGGLAGATYRILATTNIALSLAQWTPIVTNQFSASGGFSYTNVIQPNLRAQYFRVTQP